jgi:Rod binding domain-containing protein
MIKKVNLPNIQNKYVVHKGEKIPKDYMKVAQGMETQFINHLFGQLRKTINKDQPESQAKQYYDSLLDYERAKIMSSTESGVGLKDMVLDEIYPKFRREKIAQDMAQKAYSSDSDKLIRNKDLEVTNE